jgi:hypothetical protein
LDVHAVCAEGGAAVAEQGTGQRRAVGAAAMTQVDGRTIGAKRRALSRETHRNALFCRESRCHADERAFDPMQEPAVVCISRRPGAEYLPRHVVRTPGP